MLINLVVHLLFIFALYFVSFLTIIISISLILILIINIRAIVFHNINIIVLFLMIQKAKKKNNSNIDATEFSIKRIKFMFPLVQQEIKFIFFNRPVSPDNSSKLKVQLIVRFSKKGFKLSAFVFRQNKLKSFYFTYFIFSPRLPIKNISYFLIK